MAATTQSWIYSTQVVVVSSGASIASNAFSASGDVFSSLATTNTGGYSYADVCLKIDVAASVSSASNVVFLYRRDLNIDSTNDAPQPQSAAPAYSAVQVGVFSVPPVTASTTNLFLVPLSGPVELTSACEFYIEDKTNATINAGWTLKFTPKSPSYS